MKIRSLAFATASAFLAIASAHAQTASTGGAGQMPPPLEIPAACKNAEQVQMSGMSGNMSGGMQGMSGMMGGMDDAHQGYMQAMMRMNPAMMQGMMAKDADMAFACSMIAHHKGAIEMAKVEIKSGDNAEMKRMAEKTMKEQEQEVTQLTNWVDKHAKK